MNTKLSGISFIVCCYNSEKLIKETIQALNNQANQNIPYEVILVDNNCTDNTVMIAKQEWKRADLKLKIVYEKKPGLSNARKKGIKDAIFDYVSFIDDDNIVEKHWVVKVYNIFSSNHKIGAIGSRNIALLDAPPPFWFAKHQLNYACGKQLPDSGYVKGKRKHLWGAGLSVRKTIIESIFNSALPMYLTGRKGNIIAAGDDSEICMRITLNGWDLWYEDNLTLNHKIQSFRLNWKYFCKLHLGFGYCSPIVRIYQALIDNQSPETYIEAVIRNSKLLIKLIMTHNIKLIFKKEGAEYQRSFNFVVGNIKSLISLKNTYNTIIKEIQKEFI